MTKLNRKELKSLPLDHLADHYSALTIQQGVATQTGDYETGNECVEGIEAIAEELRTRVPNGLDALLPLLEHDNSTTRLWAAAHLFGHHPREATDTLTELSHSTEIVGLSAQETLKRLLSKNRTAD